MSSQIQKSLFLQLLRQDSMSISATSSLSRSLAPVRLPAFTSSMSARSIGGKGFLQYWKVLYCQNSSLSRGLFPLVFEVLSVHRTLQTLPRVGPEAPGCVAWR